MGNIQQNVAKIYSKKYQWQESLSDGVTYASGTTPAIAVLLSPMDETTQPDTITMD